MNLYVGKVVGTHGIKGEIRVLSDFQFKDKIFVVGKKLIIGNQEYVIRSYRRHKNFDMVTLNDYKDINEVLFLVKKKVYVLKENLDLDEQEILDEDLINFKVLTTDGKSGIIKEIFLASPDNKIIRVMFDHEVLIPLSSPMIKSISKEKREVTVELLSGM